MVLVVVLGVPFTLWWWKLADSWLPSHHRRFAPPPADTREKIVVRLPSDAPGTHDTEGRS